MSATVFRGTSLWRVVTPQGNRSGVIHLGHDPNLGHCQANAQARLQARATLMAFSASAGRAANASINRDTIGVEGHQPEHLRLRRNVASR